MQQLHLLASASEDEGVAALQAHDRPAGARVLDEERVRVALRHLPAAADLAHVDDDRVLPDDVERLEGDELVVQDDVGARAAARARAP